MIKEKIVLIKIAMILVMLSASGNSQQKRAKEISPPEAFELLQNQSVYLIDVRSVAEYVFVGHPEMAYNIPFEFWDENKQKLVLNKRFIKDIKARFKPSDTLIFICRSGGRSSKAAESALRAGFNQVFSIKEGFEGDIDDEGFRRLNGWKIRGLPSTYELNEKLVYKR